MDDFASVIKIIILLSAFPSIPIAFDYVKGQKINPFEYIILIMFSTLSMLLIVPSYDPIGMYLAIELQSLSLYVPAAFQRNNEFSTEAGPKHSTLGALSSGLPLLGESIIHGSTGITNLEELTKFNMLWARPPAPNTDAPSGSATPEEWAHLYAQNMREAHSSAPEDWAHNLNPIAFVHTYVHDTASFINTLWLYD